MHAGTPLKVTFYVTTLLTHLICHGGQQNMVLQKLKQIVTGMDQKFNKKVFDKGYISGHQVEAVSSNNNVTFH